MLALCLLPARFSILCEGLEKNRVDRDRKRSKENKNATRRTLRRDTIMTSLLQTYEWLREGVRDIDRGDGTTKGLKILTKTRFES